MGAHRITLRGLILVLAVPLACILLLASAVDAGQDSKVTICHAAGLEGTTKYVTLTIAYPAVYGPAGHFYENGTPRAGHEEDYLGACLTPSTDPTPTIVASPTGTPVPSQSAESTPTPALTPTPLPSQTAVSVTTTTPQPTPASSTPPVVPDTSMSTLNGPGLSIADDLLFIGMTLIILGLALGLGGRRR